jgi:amino acid transporter
MENKKSISSLGALALSIGTAIGWGSFAVTSSSFLSKSGPLGSIIGLLLGMVFMLVIAYNYHYLMNKFPNTNGGIYSYAKNTLGGDHAFMVSWLLIITYLALLWANVSSLTVFSRHLFGNTFQFGFHYTLWGYEIWFGELLLCLVFLAIFGGICFLKKKITSWVQMFFVILFVVIIFIGFFAAAIMHQGGFDSFKPDFALNGDNEFMQILNVISMIPWAFIGFESISNSAKDIKTKNTFKILAISVIITTLLYLMLCLLSISAFPSQYGNWYEYLTDIDNIGSRLFYLIKNMIESQYLRTKDMISTAKTHLHSEFYTSDNYADLKEKDEELKGLNYEYFLNHYNENLPKSYIDIHYNYSNKL